MTRSSNRHYRVVQRDKDLETEKFSKEMLTQVTLISLVVYLISVMISLTLGYFIGKNQ